MKDSISRKILLAERFYIEVDMAAKKIVLDPDVVLEWLLERGYVEQTNSASNPYRIAINEEDDLPYSITFLSKKLSERYCNTKLRSTNRKSWKRELFKCLDEYQIKYIDKGTRGSMYWEFRETTKRYLERKLGIDLDALHEFDRDHRKDNKGGMRYTSYFNQAKGRHGEEKALKLFKIYFDRRMEDLNKDCRNGKPWKAQE